MELGLFGWFEVMLVESTLLSSYAEVWFLGATLDVGSLLLGYEMFCWDSFVRFISLASSLCML